MRFKTVIPSLLRIAKIYRGWKYNFKFWKSALSKKLGGKYALDSKIIWSSDFCGTATKAKHHIEITLSSVCLFFHLPRGFAFASATSFRETLMLYTLICEYSGHIALLTGVWIFCDIWNSDALISNFTYTMALNLVIWVVTKVKVSFQI